MTRRLEGQQSFSWTAICLIITVSKWYKPRTVFDLVSCESVLKWRERVHQIQCSPVRVKRHPSHAVQACTFARALSAYVFRAGPRPTVKSPFQKRFGTMLEGISFGSTPTKTSLKNLLAPLSRGPKVKEGLLLIYRADHSLRAVICEDKCLTEGREDSDEHVYLGMVLGKALSSLSLCRHLGHHSCYSFKGEEVIGFEKNGLRLVCPTSESQFSTPVHGFFIWQRNRFILKRNSFQLFQPLRRKKLKKGRFAETCGQSWNTMVSQCFAWNIVAFEESVCLKYSCIFLGDHLLFVTACTQIYLHVKFIYFFRKKLDVVSWKEMWFLHLREFTWDKTISNKHMYRCTYICFCKI